MRVCHGSSATHQLRYAIDLLCEIVEVDREPYPARVHGCHDIGLVQARHDGFGIVDRYGDDRGAVTFGEGVQLATVRRERVVQTLRELHVAPS